MELGFGFSVGCDSDCKYKWPVGTKREDLLFCSGCQEMVYCSDACAKKDWPKHMSYCKGVKGSSRRLCPSQESIESGKLIMAEFEKCRQALMDKQIK